MFAFLPALWWAQPEQFRQFEAESLLLADDLEGAFALMSSHERDDYPPHWNPPPRRGYREKAPSLDAVALLIEQDRPAEWVAQIYMEKLEISLKGDLYPALTHEPWPKLVDMLLTHHRGPEIAHQNREDLRFLLKHHRTLLPDDRLAIQSMIDFPEPSDP